MELNPIQQFNPVTVVGVIAIFLVAHLILRKTFFVPVISVMEARHARIEEGRQVRGKADRLVAEAQEQAAVILSDATAERQKAAEAVEAEIAAARDARLALATAQAESLLATGREEVAALKEAEEARMRDTLTACVVETLSKVMGEVDETAVRAMVEKELVAQGLEGKAT